MDIGIFSLHSRHIDLKPLETVSASIKNMKFYWFNFIFFFWMHAIVTNKFLSIFMDTIPPRISDLFSYLLVQRWGPLMKSIWVSLPPLLTEFKNSWSLRSWSNIFQCLPSIFSLCFFYSYWKTKSHTVWQKSLITAQHIVCSGLALKSQYIATCIPLVLWHWRVNFIALPARWKEDFE